MVTTMTVPEYAWSWLQRSRDVVQEIAARLTGDVPGPGFMEALRPQLAADAFVRDVVIGVVVDVAFNGRVPSRRPAGAAWDRGLTWWAAACAGTTVAEFERRSQVAPPPQPRLFGAESEQAVVPSVRRRAEGETPRPRVLDRVRVVEALRGLLAHEEAGSVPAAAVRALMEQLERG
jgi:hypothetical protein